jgi:deoxyguanosine kinase
LNEFLYHNITIEGNIGAGKTTLSRALADDLDARLILESFETNPFLERFYADRGRYAFQVEMFFLAERYHQLSKNLLGDIFHQFTVSDYLFTKSAIFSGVNLEGSEHELFLNLFRIMERFMPKPDLLVYLHLPLPQVETQIKQRGRSYEQAIQRDYLSQIEAAYWQYLKEENRFPVVILDDRTDGERQISHSLGLIKDILKRRWPNGISHYSPHSEF